MTLFIAEDTDSTFVVRPGENTLQAAASAIAAANSAEDAALSAATAEAASGPTYASTAAGLAATTNGQAFAVDAGGGLVSVYLNSAGTAVLQRTLATTAYLASTAGAGAVGFVQSGTGAVARTVQAKGRDVVSVKDFGATGDGVTDDTAAIQAALDSGYGEIIFVSGHTYIINGGLTVSTNGQNLSATGATIKLKDNATAKGMLLVNTSNVTVDGGTWNGNKANGNTASSRTDAYGIFMRGDYNTVKNAKLVDSYGVGIRGEGSYMLAENNTISGTTNYGILYGGSDVDQTFYGNRVVGNRIDMSAGGTIGQGILITTFSGLTNNQFYWEICGNYVLGTQDPTTGSQGINLAARGTEGICSNNITKYGAMGFSEGGNGSVVSNNVFLDMIGSARYGIEPIGDDIVVTGNVIKGARRGIISSRNTSGQSVNRMNISNNVINAEGEGISIQVVDGATAYDCIISGNKIHAASALVPVSLAKCISFTNDVKGVTIVGNSIKGGSVVNSYGIFFDNPPTGDINATIASNVISNVHVPFALNVLSGKTVNNAVSANNTLINNTSPNNFSRSWFNPSAGSLGTNVVNIGNTGFNSSSGIQGAQFNIVDHTENLLFRYGTANPEGSVTAGPGSFYIRKNGGSGAVLYVKETGTGNTGWVAK